MLKNECKDTLNDFFIHFGMARSSKQIEYLSEENLFEVFNGIDGLTQTLTEKGLGTHSNILDSINKGSFYRLH